MITTELGQKRVTQDDRPRLSPSVLARLVLCPAYVSSPMTVEQRLSFQGMHALVVVKVIARHLRMGYRLKSVEQIGNGYRTDLIFEERLTQKTRLSEVKSSRQIREVHKIQAALYDEHVKTDEIVVSSSESDDILEPDFIQEVQRQAERTRQLLVYYPELAAKRYTPHEDCCYVCSNESCPFLSTQPQSKLQQHATVSVGP
jgi:hypothetical protein